MLTTHMQGKGGRVKLSFTRPLSNTGWLLRVAALLSGYEKETGCVRVAV